jgi:hypothetical protein
MFFLLNFGFGFLVGTPYDWCKRKTKGFAVIYEEKNWTFKEVCIEIDRL